MMFRRLFLSAILWLPSLQVVAFHSRGLSISQQREATATPTAMWEVKEYAPASLGVSSQQAAVSRRYLIASFTDIKQVAYCHLPDNVWRPLVMGVVAAPGGLAVDTANARLFVSDPAVGKIYWYQLSVRSDGLLWTNGQQFVAVEGFSAKAMAINGAGDLYFTGKANVQPPEDSYEAIFRQDAVNLIKGVATEKPVEVYSRSNTGSPNPKVWMPSGIAVDSFSIYWANEESGTTYGSVVKAPRLNVAVVQSSTSAGASILDSAFDEVRGMTVTTTNIYFLTPAGVYGIPKSTSTVVEDATVGLIASVSDGDSNTGSFDPRSIAWDGDGTAYVTDPTAGVVYSMPSMDLETHQFTKFVDAPGVAGVAVANFDSYMLTGGTFDSSSDSSATDESSSSSTKSSASRFASSEQRGSLLLTVGAVLALHAFAAVLAKK